MTFRLWRCLLGKSILPLCGNNARLRFELLQNLAIEIPVIFMCNSNSNDTISYCYCFTVKEYEWDFPLGFLNACTAVVVFNRESYS